MTTLSIQLTRGAAVPESFAVDGEKLFVGTAAYCEIRLGPGEGAAEHVAIVNGVTGLHAEALAFDPPPTLDGAPFTVAPLLPDSVLAIGGVKIRASTVSVVATAGAKPKQEKTNPLVYVVAAVMIPYFAMDLLAPAPDNGLAAPQNPPALFAEASASCPHSDSTLAAAFAAEQLELAERQRERRPFHARDGVHAVRTFRTAAVCFQAGGEEDQAASARRAAADLERDLEESYRTHRVRLEHALSVKNYLMARREVRALLDLTNGKSGEYVAWLASVGRRIELMQVKK